MNLKSKMILSQHEAKYLTSVPQISIMYEMIQTMQQAQYVLTEVVRQMKGRSKLFYEYAGAIIRCNPSGNVSAGETLQI